MIQLGFNQDEFEILLILIKPNNWIHIENIDSNQRYCDAKTDGTLIT